MPSFSVKHVDEFCILTSAEKVFFPPSPYLFGWQSHVSLCLHKINVTSLKGWVFFWGSVKLYGFKRMVLRRLCSGQDNFWSFGYLIIENCFERVGIWTCCFKQSLCRSVWLLEIIWVFIGLLSKIGVAPYLIARIYILSRPVEEWILFIALSLYYLNFVSLLLTVPIG